MKKPSEAIKIVNLDHLGIVAGIIDEMELVEEVNKKVGVVLLCKGGRKLRRLSLQHC
ncbi:DUF4277 domain-containing protein [Microcoleus sp. BROC3]